MAPVMMKCLTTKTDFEVENPEVVQLKNGRYAYRAPCPTPGKNGEQKHAYKFCNAAAYRLYHNLPEPSAEPAAEEVTKSEVS